MYVRIYDVKNRRTVDTMILSDGSQVPRIGECIDIDSYEYKIRNVVWVRESTTGFSVRLEVEYCG